MNIFAPEQGKVVFSLVCGICHCTSFVELQDGKDQTTIPICVNCNVGKEYTLTSYTVNGIEQMTRGIK